MDGMFIGSFTDGYEALLQYLNHFSLKALGVDLITRGSTDAASVKQRWCARKVPCEIILKGFPLYCSQI
jgi:hypothetical protein